MVPMSSILALRFLSGLLRRYAAPINPFAAQLEPVWSFPAGALEPNDVY